MSSLTIRKHISLKEDEYELIEKNARLQGISFSEFLRKNCDHVSEKEQAEIDTMNIDYSDLDGEKININDLL